MAVPAVIPQAVTVMAEWRARRLLVEEHPAEGDDEGENDEEIAGEVGRVGCRWRGGRRGR